MEAFEEVLRFLWPSESERQVFVRAVLHLIGPRLQDAYWQWRVLAYARAASRKGRSRYALAIWLLRNNPEPMDEDLAAVRKLWVLKQGGRN